MVWRVDQQRAGRVDAARDAMERLGPRIGRELHRHRPVAIRVRGVPFAHERGQASRAKAPQVITMRDDEFGRELVAVDGETKRAQVDARQLGRW